jgi:isopropylmalate/homocitrate/citramalate synthase
MQQRKYISILFLKECRTFCTFYIIFFFSCSYEIMTPASIGLSKTSLVLGKHSGRAAYAARMSELGLSVAPGPALDALVDKLKILADEKKIVTDADIEALAYAGMAQVCFLLMKVFKKKYQV